MRDKIWVWLFAFCSLATGSFSQLHDFKLKIHITGIDSADFEFILVGDHKKLSDNIVVNKLSNENYLVSGKLEYPSAANFFIKNRRGTKNFYLDFGEQSINTSFDSLRYPLIVNGSKVNKEFIEKYTPFIAAFKKADTEWLASYWAMEKKYNEDIPFKIKDSMLRIDKRNFQMRDSLIQRYITHNPKSYIGFWALYDRFFISGYTPSYDSSFLKLDKKIRKSVDGVKMKERLITSRQVTVGRKFPEMNLVDTFGIKKSLTPAFSGYTLIDFWYSNCSPCIAQFDKFKELHKTYFPKGFEIIGISTDKKKNEMAWKKIIQKYEIPWIQLWDMDAELAQKFSINSFPSNFLLDKEGKIIQIDIDPAQLEVYLNAHLK